MKFLIDQNADYFGNQLENLGHEVDYVTKLREKDPKFRNDHNLLKHAEINKMILITKDGENGQACLDNNIQCIWLSDEVLFEKLVLPQLNSLKNDF